MSYGDHWSEPARCSRCGQERSTHDDGECAVVATHRSLTPPRLKLTFEEAEIVMTERKWGHRYLGPIIVVGPQTDGIVEARGQGLSLEEAVAKAMEGDRA